MICLPFRQTVSRRATAGTRPHCCAICTRSPVVVAPHKQRNSVKLRDSIHPPVAGSFAINDYADAGA
jgi:hypothetical protein